MTIHDLVRRLQAAETGAERSRLIGEHAALTGAPRGRVTAQLRAAGWRSRRARSDAGATRVPEEHLRLLAAALRTGVRKGGQRTLGVQVALQTLRQSGIRIDVTPAQAARLLRDRGLDVATQSAPTSHTALRSEHPNHVHQVDASVCTLYYLRGRQHDAAAIHEPYKNKDFMRGKERLKVWRYVVVDHKSGCFVPRYYQQAAETAEATWDALLRAWERNPPERWHGVPRIVMWDKGTEHAAIRAALEQGFGITCLVHAPGNARTKGAVEAAMWAIEQGFESRLRLQHPESLDELNEAALEWAVRCCANTIEGLDTRLDRRVRKICRQESWSRITPEQLVELPPGARDFAMHRAQTRKVRGDLTVSFRHPLTGIGLYDVARLRGVAVGRTINVQPLSLDRGGAVRAWTEHGGREWEARLTPLAHDQDGQREDAITIGSGAYRTHRTGVERAGAELRELAGEYGPGKEPFGGAIRALDAARKGDGDDGTVSFVPRLGEPLAAPSPHLAVVEIARLWKRLAGADWREETFDAIAARWPRGAAQTEVEQAFAAAAAEDEQDQQLA